MRRSLAIALLVLASACGTTPVESNVDEPRMSAVERAASDRGVKVYWVIPPRKPEAPAKSGG